MSQINLDKKNEQSEDYNPYSNQVENRDNENYQPKPGFKINWKMSILLTVIGTVVLNLVINFLF